MNKVFLFALVVVMAATVAMGADQTFSDGPVTVKVAEMGGKMTVTVAAVKNEDDDNSDEEGDDDDDDDITATTAEPEPTTATTTAQANQRRRRRSTNDASKDNVVEMMLMSLHEMNAAGEAIGAKKANSQAMDSFDDVTFTLAEPEMSATLMESKNMDDGMIKAVSVAGHVEKEGATVSFTVAIAKEDGNITLHDETTMVKAGQGKVNFMVEGWTWCTEEAANCKNDAGDVNEVGAFLDLKFAVKGEGDIEKKDAEEGMSLTYDIGNGNHLFMSRMVKLMEEGEDDEWATMATDYPKHEATEDGMTVFTIRLPKFVTSVWYDPSLRMTVPGGDSVGAGNAITACVALIMAGVLAAFFRI